MRTCFIGVLGRGLCGIAGLAATAGSGQNVKIDVVGRYPGTIWALDVAGDFAYVSESWNFAIVDVSNPAQPVRLGSIGLPYGPEGICVSGTLAYVADYSGGFYVIDVSRPRAPRVPGSCSTPDLAVDVQFSGSAAYVAAWNRGVQVIDVSNPGAPRIAGSYDTPDVASRLCVSGGRAYVADSASGIQILDISAPYAPARIGSYNTPDSAEGVFVLGDTAYVADWGTGLLILDVSDPAAPRLLGGYNTPGNAANLVVSGNLAYVADWNGGLRIVDVSNPGAPVSVGSYATRGDAARVALSGGLVYMTTRAQGLWIFRVTIPDTTPPVITLLGDNPVFLPEGTAYLEPGFTATDDVDGDITGRVTVTGPIDPAIPGTYMLRYEVTDAAGNPAEAKTRRVDVVDAEFRLLQIGSPSEDGVEITWSSRAGAGYAVWSSADLASGAWTQEAVVMAQGGSTTWSDVGPLSACKYYRVERCVDTDRDGVPDPFDGCPSDGSKTEPGACGCGVADTDTDSDTVPDCNDLCPLDPLKTEPKACGCGVADTDTDGDTVPDCNDLCPGHDDRVDANGNGIPDDCEFEEGWTVLLPGGLPLFLVGLPAGSFEMGSPSTESSRQSDEGPVHTVTIEYRLYIGKYEVTQAQWVALMGSWPGAAPSSSNGVGDDYPAYYVNWDDARTFVAALNNHITATGQGPLTVRLPTEAEWEYACRAGTQTRFSFGDSLGVADACEDDGVRSAYMWYCAESNPGGTKPVGTKLPNAFGLYDTHGNVYEWCEDWYHPSYTGAPVDGSAWISPAASYRVVRGGSWSDYGKFSRSAYRGGSMPANRYDFLGFRVAAVE